MSPLGKCIGVAAALATLASLASGVTVLTNSKIGDGIGKVFPLIIVAVWVLSFVPTFAVTSSTLYIRARLKKDSPVRVRELGFVALLGMLAAVVLALSILTRIA